MSASQLFCLLRKKWVNSSPEEQVRQQWIAHMTTQLGYPLSHLVSEKGLSLIPWLKEKQLPFRRIDLICFAKNIHPNYALYPLLVMEFKALTLSQRVFNQITGYNYYINACYVAVANTKQIFTGVRLPEEGYHFFSGLPSYEELIKNKKAFFA